MSHHVITWKIDIFDAETPEEAMRRALAIMRDPESVATIFTAENQDTGERITIDIEDGQVYPEDHFSPLEGL